MGFKPGDNQTLSNGEKYYFHPKHRGGISPNASVWVVSCKDEFNMCDEAITKKYCQSHDANTKFAYNMKSSGNSFIQLGTNASNDKLILAKYNENIGLTQWHGYPANYVANNQDHPHDSILSEMYKNKLISKSEMKKIKRGQKI